MDMGDGSFIDEFSHSDLFGHDDGASGFDWADDLISAVEVEDRPTSRSSVLETSVVHNNHQSVQYGQTSGQLSGQPAGGTVNLQFVQSSNTTQTVQQATVQPQPAQLLPNLTNLSQGGQLFQGVNGQLFLKTLPNGQFQLATQPQIQQIQQHPQQSSSPIPIQPHPQGSPHIHQTPNQSPIPISSPHVGSSSSSASPHASRSLTPLQQQRQYQNVNMLQIPGSQSQQQIIRNLPISSQISNISNFQTQQIIQSQGHILSNQGQVLQSHGHTQVPNQGQNYVNTQNTVIQNPNVVNVNVAHVLCSSQFQGQQGQIQGTLIQTADGKHIIIPSSQLPSNNQFQIQNVNQMLQPQIIPTSSGTGTTPLVQGGQVVETNAAALGGMGYIRIATPTSSSQETKVQPQTATHFLGLNQQGQQILIQRQPTPTPGQNIVLRQVTPPNVLQLPQQQTLASNHVLPQTTQATQQILLPQVQKIMTGSQGQQQVKLVAAGNHLQSNNLPMTINIGGQNVILPSNIQQLIQQQQLNQLQKQASSTENLHQTKSSIASMVMATSTSTSNLISSGHNSTQLLNTSMMNNPASSTSQVSQGHNITSQVPTFLLPNVSASTANMTPVTTTVSQTKQMVSQINISSSPKMYQTIPSVASSVTSTVTTGKPFLSAVNNAPKLPMTTIQLTPQAQQKINAIQKEIRKLQSLRDPTDQQKQQLVRFSEALKQIIAKGHIKIQPAQGQMQLQQVTSNQTSNATPMFIGQPAVSVPQLGHVLAHHQSTTPSQSSSSPLVNQSQAAGAVQSQISGGLPAQGLVTSDNSFTSMCTTKSVQSQSGSIMSISPTGNKSQQQPVQPSNVTILGQSQAGMLLQQGQPSVLKMAIQSNQNVTPTVGESSTVSTSVKMGSIVVPGKVPINPNPQVAVPTQIKIASHLLTLNLTPDQKDKVQKMLSTMPQEQQQQQMALFLKLQQQQKMNAQVQAQIQHQKKLQQNVQGTSNIQAQLPSTIQPTIIPIVPSTTASTILLEHPGTSPSKPNIVHRVSVAAIPKHQLIHQQMGKDQANAIVTDTKTPFRNQRDTYRRLLRYHVFQTKNPPDDLVKKDDEMFDDLSEGLVRKKDWMFEKYRSLILEESMREKQTAEIMMIQKMLNEDLKETLEEEKRVIKRNPDEFDPMPRKYLKLEPGTDESPDIKFDPNSIQIKRERVQVPSPSTPTPLIKKESFESDNSRPSTPKFKLVIKSSGQGYSSSITEEEIEQTNVLESSDTKEMNFMSGIHVKEEQIDIDSDEVPLDRTLEPFESYSQDRHSESNVHSDDLIDDGADSDSDVTVVSDDDNKTNDAIVIDDDDDDDDNHEEDEDGDNEMEEDDNEDNSENSKGDNFDEIMSRKSSVEPVIKHEDISNDDFNDFFSNKYESGSSELSYYTRTTQQNPLTADNIISSLASVDQISNDVSYSQNSDAHSAHNSDAHSTQTIPYSEDGNSIKDEDLSNDVDYNKSASSFAHYEPISSPEADQSESFSNYLPQYDSSSFNLGGIRDQHLHYGLSNPMRESSSNNHMTGSESWEEEMEEESENADKIKAEMESAINSILSLN
ncbi:Hypothetical predicted protein [Mytilus galloprovincialis]|uniref:GLTSCR protein conserved domain-containing protein n=1 Tax=Mytilus galloprovincialis TaxID=29158 RepID=A0A8B6CWK8_MYTGA|nr:Hypothetical predicted protein [Mytilus galloprovincialis]